MALGRRNEERQSEFWVATKHLPVSPGHVFYEKLNSLLAEAGFDEWVETLCEPYYAKGGRNSIPPGVYFRMLMVGYFEGIGSQRGIAWRCSDSLSIRSFLGIPATEDSPDHSSLSVIRERLPSEVHKAAFVFVLELARKKNLLDGRTVGVDSTTLEANAAMKSIVRRDTGEDWQAYLTGLMREAGAVGADETPTVEQMKRFDKSRKGKKVSNDDWESPSDPDSRIAKMKDGTTHLAYKAEHAVDLKTEMIVSAEIYYADQGDTHTIEDTVRLRQVNLLFACACEVRLPDVRCCQIGELNGQPRRLASPFQIATSGKNFGFRPCQSFCRGVKLRRELEERRLSTGRGAAEDRGWRIDEGGRGNGLCARKCRRNITAEHDDYNFRKSWSSMARDGHL